MTIQSLESVPFQTLFEAFSDAFRDYEIQPNAGELRNMLKRRGFNPALSFGAFEDKRLISFTFNGTGKYRGLPTAYDTGTGTCEEYRGRGLATKIFEYSLPHLRKAGITKYLLEVLQHNTKAVSVYQKLGFESSREFNYFKQNTYAVRIPDKPLKTEYTIKQMKWQNCQPLEEFGDYLPSWQNSFASIERGGGDFMAFGAFMHSLPVGYCVLEPLSGDITQLAVNRLHRRQGIGTALLNEALKHNRYHEIKLINADAGNEATAALLKTFNIALAGRQFEMIKCV